MEDHLGEHDPNRAILESEREGVKPDTFGGKDIVGERKELKGVNAGQQAKESLNAAEKVAASSKPKQVADNLAGAKQAEDKTGLYSGSGKGIAEAGDGKIKSKFKKWLATGVIFGVLGVSGTFFGLSAFQPFSLVAQFVENFNSMHVSANTRASRFFKEQMSNGRTKNPIKGSAIFGKHFKITEKQNESLKQQGIEYDDTTFKDANGKTIKVLKYDDGSGTVKIVTADARSAKRLNETDLGKYNTDKIKYDPEAIEFKILYADNMSFFQGYNRGSMTWRGAIANWFGTRTAHFLKTNKLTRNMWEKWQERLQEVQAEGGDPVKAANDVIDERAKGMEDGGMRVVKDDKETDEDGKEKLSKPETEGAETIKRSDMTSEKVRTKLDTISRRFNSAANIGCAIMGTLGAINLMVQAWEMMQILQLATGYFEAVDKTKAGLGEDAPINEMTATFNEKGKNIYYIFEPTGVKKDSEKEADKIGETVKTKKVYTDKTAMESEGIAALYSGGAVNPNDPSVASFNLFASSKQILGGLSLSMKSFEGCLMAKAGAAAVSAVVDGLSVAGCIAGLVGAAFTFGATATACTPFVVNSLKGIALSVGLAAVLSALISVVAPTVANMMMRNLITTAGDARGNALFSAAHAYEGGTHKSNGGSLATLDEYSAYAVAQKQVIAENAKYERAELSPFDITSKNTFMGTLLTQLMSYMHTNTLMSTVTTSNSVVSSALVSIVEPSAMAYDITANLPSMEDYENTCPYLASIGAVGDAFCNPYIMTDLSTMDEDPADVIDKVYNYGGIDESSDDENIIIKKDSDLAKYIRYCDDRNSPFGVADQSIASEVGDFGTVDSNAGNGAIGAVPVVGDVIEIIDDAEQMNNVGYISGESCVAGNDVNAASSPNWNKAKYYQRFVEDQSLAESMGLIEKSAVTAYLEDYYKEHPLDNSREGILARYSGLDKETVVALLDVIEYYNFVANYDASDRYAFGEQPIETERKIQFDNENVLAGDVTLIDHIVYADVRNRVFVV